MMPKSTLVVTVQTHVNSSAVGGAMYYTAAKVEQGSGSNMSGLFSNWLRMDIDE